MASTIEPSAGSGETIDLKGRRILVVEDDYVLAKDVCEDLRRHGATVLGPAPTSYYAHLLLLGKRGVDAAILDVRLHGAEVHELAYHLRQRGVPMLFTTGYGPEAVHRMFRNERLLLKPITSDELLSAVAELLEHGAPAEPAPSADKAPSASHRTGANLPGAARESVAERWSRLITRAMAAGLSDQPKG